MKTALSQNARKIGPSILMAWLAALGIAVTSGCSTPEGTTSADKRESILSMKEATLTELYESKPYTKKLIRKAAGYAVFSDISINVLLVSAGNGYGVVVDNSTKQKTYMKMAQIGVGLGLGVKDFRAVFVFHNKSVLDKFIDKGWEFGAHADAAAKAGEKGGAVTGAASLKDMEIYQFTKNGIALQATIAGTKYWKYHELN